MTIELFEEDVYGYFEFMYSLAAIKNIYDKCQMLNIPFRGHNDSLFPMSVYNTTETFDHVSHVLELNFPFKIYSPIAYLTKENKVKQKFYDEMCADIDYIFEHYDEKVISKNREVVIIELPFKVKKNEVKIAKASIGLYYMELYDKKMVFHDEYVVFDYEDEFDCISVVDVLIAKYMEEKQ